MAKPKRRARPDKPARLLTFSLDLLRRGRSRDILSAMGEEPRFGLPRRGVDRVAVWGRAATSARGQRVAKSRNNPLVTLEDGFVRSMRTGRQGDESHSMVFDDLGIYFETEAPNRLFDLIKESQVISDTEFALAERGIAQLKRMGLSKYNTHADADTDLPDEYVLVIDQTFNDASIDGAGVTAEVFDTMLRAAVSENPGKTILIKTHPEVNAKKRKGYFSRRDESSAVKLYRKSTSPWVLFEKASKVYCVSSQMGMEAILAGHRPVVFGRAFYAGWGMTEDRHPNQPYHGLRAPVHLFWAAYLHYCNWYDPYTKRITDFETVAWNISVQRDAWLAAHVPAVCVGFRLWKRGFMRRYLQGPGGAPQFVEKPERALATAERRKGRVLVWASKETDDLRRAAEEKDIPLIRVEDGFLRSSGLGAELVQPLSLAFDDLGIYYDPNRESRLEWLIQNSENLSPEDLERAAKLRSGLVNARLSKYNLKGRELRFNPKLKQRLVLIPGQVEDDASIKTGTDEVSTNQELIWAVRQRFPNAFLIYKPHPDVEAGLRNGEVNSKTLKGVVDHVAAEADIGRLLGKVDIVATMTSLTGFEALMRGKRVVCFGTPFYAGWGLTEDHALIPKRRKAKVSLDQLVHATLIDYPSYWDPVTGDPCTPETILHRFTEGRSAPQRSSSNKALAKLQGLFASYAHLWR